MSSSNNHWGMTTTFQHLATSRFTKSGKSCLTFYGRTASGESIAVHVYDIKPYGYIKADMNWWNTESPYIMEYLKWIVAGDRMESAEKWGHIGNLRESMLRENGWLDKAAETAIVATPVKGYNIRNVHEGEPDKFIRLEAQNGNILRNVIKCIRNPEKAKQVIIDCRKKVRTLKAKRPKMGMGEDYDDYIRRCNEHASQFKMPEMPGEPHWDKVECMETHLGEDLVWMVDNKVPACGWLTVAGQISDNPRSICTLDITVDSSNSSQYLKECKEPPQPMAPFRVLSYDIESQPHVVEGQTETLFPEPERDPVLCIGVSCFDMVDMKMRQLCFMWEPEEPTTQSYPALVEDEQTDSYRQEEVEVRSFKDEYDMLLGFQRFIQFEYDPDIITGYNILNFDNVYTINRAMHLWELKDDENYPKAWCWGRMELRECRLKKKYTWTAQRGGQTTFQCKMEGREFLDVMKVVMADHKLRSYKMDNVAAEFLGTRKIEISYDDIPIMQKTQPGRIRLGGYCAKDAWIPNCIIIKMCKAINAILMSQVAGVSLDTILNRGQQIRTVSLMLKKVKERFEKGGNRWFIPDEDTPPDMNKFEGAVVIDPIPGFWDRPVATLDFASLYPSIMRAWNMCFSTILSNPKEAEQRGYVWNTKMENPTYRPVRTFTYPKGGKFEYQSLGTDICFKTADQCRGILPEILEELHSQRKLAKKQRKAFAEGSMDYNVLDGRQLALKVCMNSVYGFTGASTGFLPEKRIASAVTRAGRGMANETKFMCEDRYKEYGVKVVYGDTDSVFVHFPKSLCPGETRDETIENANKLGVEMGEMCTKAFLPPNDLEFEKVYYPLLLKGKKRYAGFKFEPGCKPKLDVKGFECVRRDFAPIVSKTQKKIFVLLCEQNNVEAAVQFARQTVIDLLEGRVPIDDLVMSKQLTRPPDQYKNPAPHVELAKYLMKTLPPTQAPKVGERINFVIKPGRGKTFERAASPDDVREGKCSIDYQWYLSNQLKEPLTRVFEMIIDNTDEIFKVNKLSKPKVGTDSMFSSWVSKKKEHSKKRTAATITIQRKDNLKKKKVATIKNFF